MPFIGNLGAQAIHLVITPRNPHQPGAKNLRPQNLGGLKIGGDEDHSLKPVAGGLRRNCIGQIAGGRAGDGIETEIASLG